MDPDRERALVERAASDPGAFAELYDFYLPRIFGYLVRRVEERVVAEDLTATTFERALGAVRSGAFRNDAFGGWLYRVAANALVDHLRRGRRYVPLGVRAADLDTADEADALASAADDRALAAFGAAIERDALARAIAVLPAGHRRVVLLRYVEGLEADELADAMGCSRATAAVRLHRALRALRSELERGASDVA